MGSLLFNKMNRLNSVKDHEIVLHIPHSSKDIPPEYLGDYFDVAELNETLLKLTDTYTNDLFSVYGIRQIVFPYSRVFCDVERFLQNEPMETEYGQGFYYTRGINLKPFRHDKNKDIVRDKYYIPHHLLFEETIRKLDNPLIIDCHSFSNEVYPCTPFSVDELQDFIIGHNGKEREIKISDFIYDHLDNLGFKVEINRPYSGSFTVFDCDSVMIEVNKSLYLKDDFLTKKVDYYKTDYTVKNLIKNI